MAWRSPYLTDFYDNIDPALDPRLSKAHAFVERHFRRVPTLEEVAAETGYSPFHFHRRFRAAYGKTPKQLATELQVAEVQRLILAGVPLARAAEAVGFAHQSHMTGRFKRLVGTTPLQWLKGPTRCPEGVASAPRAPSRPLGMSPPGRRAIFLSAVPAAPQ